MIIRNGTIYDAVHEEPYKADIQIKNGKIIAIKTKIKAEKNEKTIDAEGKLIYPGFIDAHSHLGLDGYGIGFEGSDYNEMNDIVSPQLRGIDSFNPLDPTISQAMNAGVTCVGTGPGSANVLGGTFIAVKTYGKCVDEMIVKDPVAMKCAFGENPKRVYREKGNFARMSTASKLREMLNKAKEYMAKKEAAGDDIFKKPAYDAKMEALIPVLKKEIPLKAHAHQANDILTAIRIAREFDVKLTLEHVTEGHLIADILSRYDYPCAVGPSLTHASKFELQNKSWTTPDILARKGLSVSIITDAPVIPQQHLAMCAAIAIRNGLDEKYALKAITINPARHLGIDDRVGSLEVGKDADLCIFKESPFAAGVEPEMVFIDGKKVK
ncbi:MAG: amidohydrolase family protein [Erysipelotrichaceae bacterium]|nr:amidohydrolase family protein [Erysipelotrichaceae bacterium]